MSYPRVDSEPAAPPTQDEIDAASRRRALDALQRVLTRLTGDVARDWQRCGKAACARSRRCRGFACKPETEGEEA
ncbi:MAG TPA: hypothetical protein VM029_05455 [Opitutaceae bacterium]|nr:hypothetical protein [Opitutaceae bacterium]